MSKPKARSSPHPTLSMSFQERACLPETPPLTSYLFRLMANKRTNLCLSADVQTTSQLLDVAEECGDSICVLKTHADIISDFGERTIKGLIEIAIRKKFLIFEDRKFGDIGNTVQMQYAAGVHRIASWATIVNAHIFPGPAIITSLRSAAFSSMAANNSTITTEITGGRSIGGGDYFQLEDEDPDSEDNNEDNSDADDEDTSGAEAEDPYSGTLERPRTQSSSNPGYPRKNSIVSISTTISSSAEYISPPPSASGAPFDPRPPLARGLLLLAQMSSADNLFTPAYTQRCLELARQQKDFVLGFIAQEGLNSAATDNFIVMTPGVSMAPAGSTPSTSKPRLSTGSRNLLPSKHSGATLLTKSSPSAVTGDGMGQQYNTPRYMVLEKGVDIIIVGRGILHADDRALEAARYRREGWRAITERCSGKG